MIFANDSFSIMTISGSCTVCRSAIAVEKNSTGNYKITQGCAHYILNTTIPENCISPLLISLSGCKAYGNLVDKDRAISKI
jgi:hypothetical protein